MNTYERIEAALRKIPWNPPPEVDGRVLADGLHALNQAAAATAQVSTPPAPRAPASPTPALGESS